MGLYIILFTILFDLSFDNVNLAYSGCDWLNKFIFGFWETNSFIFCALKLLRVTIWWVRILYWFGILRLAFVAIIFLDEGLIYSFLFWAENGLDSLRNILFISSSVKKLFLLELEFFFIVCLLLSKIPRFSYLFD